MRAALVALACLAAAPAAAQDEQLTVELNKFEAGEEGGGCRAFFLFRNRSATTFEGFEMALAILDEGGVIDRLLTIDAAPLPSERTTLKLFEIPETGCDGISEVLLHDVTSCRADDGTDLDCYALMELDSKASAPLVK